MNEKFAAAINTASLIVGIACFMLLIHYVQYERSFDAFNTNADRISRIIRKQQGLKLKGKEFTA